ncbi:MAG TPA: transcription antitermination factor NusB [Anaerolineae bacterium]
MKTRRDARILALLVLYEADTAQHPAGLVLQRHLAEREDVADDAREYTSQLVSGVVNGAEELNAVLGRCAPEFPVDQIAPIDRNILRIALFEIKANLVPPRVAINEAIEISKEFGSESTPRFVNGVLGAAALLVLDGKTGANDPASNGPHSQSENREKT